MNTGGYSKDLRNIHKTMTQSFEQGGPMPQAAGLQDCPFVQLPPALIEQLKHPQT
jgi:hypothetical protein